MIQDTINLDSIDDGICLVVLCWASKLPFTMEADYHVLSVEDLVTSFPTVPFREQGWLPMMAPKKEANINHMDS